ncbi:hypothetical protein ACIOEW_19515 [Streptomyces sp. NPDC087901]|uniref:hypothetical protein n=1 Tax=Streptomyces sp. NPDC087901 TaxID=3365818 RepID=UPI0038010928
MGSLFKELEAREAAARVRVEEFEVELDAVSAKLGLARLRLARETVAEVRAELTPQTSAVTVDAAGRRLRESGWPRRMRGPSGRSSGC